MNRQFNKSDIVIDAEKVIKGEMARGAVFSEDMRYRYLLTRAWALTGKRAIFALLNPSTADENQDDPTVRRCINYAKAWGYSGLWLLNIFALRATDPHVLWAPETVDPMGSYNKDMLTFIVNHERRQRMYLSDYNEDIDEIDVLCGWGTHGSFMLQGDTFLGWMDEVRALPMVLRLTKGGHPAHPLYLPKDLKPVEWRNP